MGTELLSKAFEGASSRSLQLLFLSVSNTPVNRQRRWELSKTMRIVKDDANHSHPLWQSPQKFLHNSLLKALLSWCFIKAIRILFDKNSFASTLTIFGIYSHPLWQKMLWKARPAHLSLTYESLAISLGYLIFDLTIIFKEIRDFSTLGIENIVHHFVAVIATFNACLVGSFNITAAAATTFTEISTIFLHIRYYMIKSKNADGNLFFGVMITFILTFAYSRMFV